MPTGQWISLLLLGVCSCHRLPQRRGDHLRRYPLPPACPLLRRTLDLAIAYAAVALFRGSAGALAESTRWRADQGPRLWLMHERSVAVDLASESPEFYDRLHRPASRAIARSDCWRPGGVRRPRSRSSPWWACFRSGPGAGAGRQPSRRCRRRALAPRALLRRAPSSADVVLTGAHRAGGCGGASPRAREPFPRGLPEPSPSSPRGAPRAHSPSERRRGPCHRDSPHRRRRRRAVDDPSSNSRRFQSRRPGPSLSGVPTRPGIDENARR